MGSPSRNGSTQNQFDFHGKSRPTVPGFSPLYNTALGDAYLADSLLVLKALPDDSINVVFTSPPYALRFKKEYGNADKTDYVEWFCEFGKEIFRVLAPDGSFVLNIGGSYNPGTPTRSLYHFKLLIELVETIGFSLAQECFWCNPAKMPMPAEWVTVRRVRIRDSVEYVWWLSKTAWPKANNRNVLKTYSQDMHRLNRKGIRSSVRPSGHNIKTSFSNVEAGGSIPPNVVEEGVPIEMLKFGNNAANDPYTMCCKEAGLRIHPPCFSGGTSRIFPKASHGRRRHRSRSIRRLKHHGSGCRITRSSLDRRRASRFLSGGKSVLLLRVEDLAYARNEPSLEGSAEAKRHGNGSMEMATVHRS